MEFDRPHLVMFLDSWSSICGSWAWDTNQEETSELTHTQSPQPHSGVCVCVPALTCMAMILRGMSSRCCLMLKCHVFILIMSSNMNSRYKRPSTHTWGRGQRSVLVFPPVPAGLTGLQQTEPSRVLCSHRCIGAQTGQRTQLRLLSTSSQPAETLGLTVSNPATATLLMEA